MTMVTMTVQICASRVTKLLRHTHTPQELPLHSKFVPGLVLPVPGLVLPMVYVVFDVWLWCTLGANLPAHVLMRDLHTIWQL